MTQRPDIVRMRASALVLLLPVMVAIIRNRIPLRPGDVKQIQEGVEVIIGFAAWRVPQGKPTCLCWKKTRAGEYQPEEVTIDIIIIGIANFLTIY
jgi:hypothetical protein